nr:PREDICTED: oncoprotein-induced transcript 3 protein-like [Paralichthys olivaceus]
MTRPQCEQTTLQQQDALTQVNMESLKQKRDAGTNLFYYGTSAEEEYEQPFSEEDTRRRSDPCFHYTVLDQAWRATNTSTKLTMCDRRYKWKGWYRLFFKGKSIQMPERCVPVNKCSTHAPLWLAGRHPRIRDGIVTRQVCGHWKKKCCAFRSTPIKVKKCRGNYYVYQFTKPSSCDLAYCADINTLVCGRCRRNQSCVSRDKINWRCKTRKVPSRKVHFFASYPGQLTGKVNRIKYSKVLVNVGRAYSRSTGTFRAPVKGIYQFFFSTQTANTNKKTDLWLVVNSYWVAVSHTAFSRPSSVGSLSTYMTFLRKGSRVYVTHNCGKSWANAASMTITFGGSLLVQMK